MAPPAGCLLGPASVKQVPFSPSVASMQQRSVVSEAQYGYVVDVCHISRTSIRPVRRVFMECAQALSSQRNSLRSDCTSVLMAEFISGRSYDGLSCSSRAPSGSVQRSQSHAQRWWKLHQIPSNGKGASLHLEQAPRRRDPLPCRATTTPTSMPPHPTPSGSSPPTPSMEQPPPTPESIPSSLATTLAESLSTPLTGATAAAREDSPPAAHSEGSELLAYPEDSTEGTSFGEAMLNAVNILLGVGLLSIPYALAQGGWIALAVLGALGVATNYTGKLLGICQERMCLLRSRPAEGSPMLRGLRSYEDIGEAAFGPLGRLFITAVLYIELIGTCGLFFILEGDNLARLLGGDPKHFMLLSAAVLLPTTWLPDLSALAALGALGALASSSVLAVVLYTFVSEGFPVGAAHALAHLETLPLTFGLLSFVYAGHAVFPNIKASMKEPERYPEMLDYTYLLVAGICAVVGVVGYQMYGNEVMEEITLNLPAGLVAMGATSLIVINPFTKFALTMEPVARGLEEAIQQLRLTGAADAAGKRPPPLNAAMRIGARTSLGASALFLATSVPAFAGVMATIGSCLTLVVSVIFPSVAYLGLFSDKLSRQERWWNYAVVVIGCICAAAGTYTAVGSLNSGAHSL